MRLEDNQYFLCSGGRHVIDAAGNVFAIESPPIVREPPASPPCSASPRGLPGEVKAGSGYCVRQTPAPLSRVTPSPSAVGYLRAEARWLVAQETEHFVAFHLNAQGDVCGATRMSDGQPRSCDVDIRRLVRESLSHGARGVIACHNHPRVAHFNAQRGRHWAGVIEPSAEDITTTTALRGALAAVGVHLIDHVICGPRAIGYSFRQETPWTR